MERIVYFNTNPTTEIIAIQLFREISIYLLNKSISGILQSVNVWETSNNCAIATIDSIDKDI